MSVSLLDVNILVALFDPAHLNHDDAHAWFERNRKPKWATCPLALNGCVRVLSNPANPTVEARPEDAVSLLDERLFRASLIAGHQKITDIYLLGLAVHYKGRLATFDRAIPVRAVIGAEPRLVELLG